MWRFTLVYGGLIVAEGAVAFDRCSDTVAAHPIMFTGGSGEASLELPGPWWSPSAGSSIQLTLTTNEPDGLIFYALLNHNNDDKQRSFVALELFEGARTIAIVNKYCDEYVCLFVCLLA